MNNNLPGLSPLWLICLALVLGTTIVVCIPVSIAASNSIKSSDWIGFAGSVVAGAMALIAGILAWFSVQRQIEANEDAEERNNLRQDRQRAEMHESAKLAAIIVLTQPIHAAAAAMNVTKRCIEAAAKDPPPGIGAQPYSGGIPSISLIRPDLDKAMKQLKTTLSHFAIAEAWKDLNAEDKANYLVVTSTLHTVTNIYSDPPSIPYTELVFNQHNLLQQFAIYVRAFDQELAQVYEHDSKIGRQDIATEPSSSAGPA